MTDTVSFSDLQFEKILTTIESLKNGGIHWELVIPVFLSAALGMGVGLGLEYFKSYRERRTLALERAKKELTQINITTVGLAHNVSALLHLVMQNILPHHAASTAAFQALQATNNVAESLRLFALSLHEYRGLMMTCPDMHFYEFDFLDKLPFIVEKDVELLQQAEWMINEQRVLRSAMKDRNNFIETARITTTQGEQTFYQLDTILQLQKGVANAECVSALQLFEKYLSVAKSLESVGKGYRVNGKVTMFHPPDALADAMRRLKVIYDNAVREMTAAQ